MKNADVRINYLIDFFLDLEITFIVSNNINVGMTAVSC